MDDTITVKWGELDVVLERGSCDETFGEYWGDIGNGCSLCVAFNIYSGSDTRWCATLDAPVCQTGVLEEPSTREYDGPQGAVTALYNAILSIPGLGIPWQPIATAPKDGSRILVKSSDDWTWVRWEPDEFSKKPRPFWRMAQWGFDQKTLQRSKSDTWTHWAPVNLPGGE